MVTVKPGGTGRPIPAMFRTAPAACTPPLSAVGTVRLIRSRLVSVDGWIGGQGRPERILEIMKDPRCGPMGVIALLLVVLLKFSAVLALLEMGGAPLLLLAPLLGRMALPLLFFSTPYVRRGGLGSILASHFPRRPSVVVVLLFSLTILAAYTWNGALAVGAAMGAFTLLRRTMRQTIGGTTGDTAGALVEVVEVAVVVALGLFSGA